MSKPTLIERLRHQGNVSDFQDIKRQGARYLCELTGRAADRIAELEGDLEEAETLLDILQSSDAAYNRQSVSQRRRILELRLRVKELLEQGDE